MNYKEQPALADAGSGNNTTLTVIKIQSLKWIVKFYDGIFHLSLVIAGYL